MIKVFELNWIGLLCTFSLCVCCFSLQCCKSAQLTKCDGTFWDTFKREVISRYKIQNQVGFCTDIGSFLMNYVRAGNKINSIPYSVWTVVLCFTQTYQLRFPLIQKAKIWQKSLLVYFFFFFFKWSCTHQSWNAYIYMLYKFSSVSLTAWPFCSTLPLLSRLAMT